MNELPPPTIIPSSEKSIEVARIWIVDGRPTFVLNRQMWSKPGVWGALISDLMDHVANVYEEGGLSREEALSLIQAEYESRR